MVLRILGMERCLSLQMKLYAEAWVGRGGVGQVSGNGGESTPIQLLHIALQESGCGHGCQ